MSYYQSNKTLEQSSHLTWRPPCKTRLDAKLKIFCYLQYKYAFLLFIFILFTDIDNKDMFNMQFVVIIVHTD